MKLQTSVINPHQTYLRQTAAPPATSTTQPSITPSQDDESTPRVLARNMYLAAGALALGWLTGSAVGHLDSETRTTTTTRVLDRHSIMENGVAGTEETRQITRTYGTMSPFHSSSKLMATSTFDRPAVPGLASGEARITTVPQNREEAVGQPSVTMRDGTTVEQKEAGILTVRHGQEPPTTWEHSSIAFTESQATWGNNGAGGTLIVETPHMIETVYSNGNVDMEVQADGTSYNISLAHGTWGSNGKPQTCWESQKLSGGITRSSSPNHVDCDVTPNGVLALTLENGSKLAVHPVVPIPAP